MFSFLSFFFSSGAGGPRKRHFPFRRSAISAERFYITGNEVSCYTKSAPSPLKKGPRRSAVPPNLADPDSFFAAGSALLITVNAGVRRIPHTGLRGRFGIQGHSRFPPPAASLSCMKTYYSSSSPLAYRRLILRHFPENVNRQPAKVSKSLDTL